MELPPDAPAPRHCHLIKWPDFDGYGFNLHAEKAKTGQYIGKVDEDSPAMTAGLREGDRIVEVNGQNIAMENHRQVVERIKSIPNETRLLVVDEAADRWYRERKIVVKSTQPNVISQKTPVPQPKKSVPPSDELEMKINGGENCSDHGNENGDHSEIINNNNKVKSVNGTSTRDKNEVVLENGANSRSSTPSNHPKSPENHNSEADSVHNRPSSSGSNANTGSIPGSPTSSKSGASSGGQQTLNYDVNDLNLNMSALQMRQMLAQRKKSDPKKVAMDLRKKFEIIQQM